MNSKLQTYEYHHYTHEGIREIDLTRTYQQNPERHFYNKPCGLWLSVQSPRDWEAFCLHNKLKTERLKNKFKISLKDNANILCLENEYLLGRFQQDYSRGIQVSDLKAPLVQIDWARVIEDHQGIILPVYPEWDNDNMIMMWTKTWDCTSGCIWDLGAVKEVQLL
jgi:hypothetical protein